MLGYIVCPSCGCPLGDKADIFNEMYKDMVNKILKERNTNIMQADIDSGLQIPCGEILDQLDIKKICCRTHMITPEIFSRYY